jgi:outer membrane protein TolC
MQNFARHSVWVLSAVVFLLAACATVPDLGVAPDPKAAATYSSTVSFTAPATDWPADGWWQAYADAQLSDLIETALQGSPTLAQAKARVLKAQAAAGEAKSSTLPTLEIDGSVSELKQSLNQGFPPVFQQYLPRGYNSSGYVALKFGYEFDFWGKNRSAVAAATSEVRAAQAEAAEARLALSTAVALAYAAPCKTNKRRRDWCHGASTTASIPARNSKRQKPVRPRPALKWRPWMRR